MRSQWHRPQVFASCVSPPVAVKTARDVPFDPDSRQHICSTARTPQKPGTIVAQLRDSVSRVPHLWLVMLALAAGACSSDTPAGPSPGDPTAIAVTCTSTTLGHDCRASLQRTSGPAEDVTTIATWTSSSTTVATVDAGGHVTHRGSGQAEIRATYQDVFGGAIILVNISSHVAQRYLPAGRQRLRVHGQVGYLPDSIYREGTPMPEDSRSYARVGNDTNNNINDFVRQSRSPLNSTASCAFR